jgi:hypothetical protein
MAVFPWRGAARGGWNVEGGQSNFHFTCFRGPDTPCQSISLSIQLQTFVRGAGQHPLGPAAYRDYLHLNIDVDGTTYSARDFPPGGVCAIILSVWTGAYPKVCCSMMRLLCVANTFLKLMRGLRDFPRSGDEWLVEVRGDAGPVFAARVLVDPHR